VGPALSRNIRSASGSEERFYGYFDEEELLGAISLLLKEQEGLISRLMVHPDHFRKGIASRLLNCVLNLDYAVQAFKVYTGELNKPAVQLYLKHGFSRVGKVEVKEGIQLSEFKRIQRPQLTI
jgi:GNAT superfamily N-acetyltransferase